MTLERANYLITGSAGSSVRRLKIKPQYRPNTVQAIRRESKKL